MRVGKGRKETKPECKLNFMSLNFVHKNTPRNLVHKKQLTKILLGYWVVGGWGGGQRLKSLRKQGFGRQAEALGT
jgi:hypothetical protein